MTHQFKFFTLRFLSRQNVENKFVLTNKFFFVTSIQFVASALRENLSNRSSGVQIARDICAPFGRYLYSTKCTWIIKCISPTKISEWNEVGYLSSVSAHETKRNYSRLDELPVDCRVSASKISSLRTYTTEWGGTPNEIWEIARWLNQVTNPV